MLKNLNDCATALVHEGFVIVPPHLHNIPVQLIEDAGEANFELIKVLMSLDCQTRFFRPGEAEAEVGLVPPRAGKDIKYFLHTAHDFMSFVRSVRTLQCALTPHRLKIDGLLGLYDELNFLNQRLLNRVCDLVPVWHGRNAEVVGSYTDSCQRSIPDGTTTLRGLWYKAEDKHEGAQGHIDRSLLTDHLGDIGGTLYGHRVMGDNQSFTVSPPSGHILVFWGIKAPILTNGFLKPLWHSARSYPGEDRRAHVLFGHIRTPVQIDCSKEAFKQFCRQQEISDGQDWYAERWHS